MPDGFDLNLLPLYRIDGQEPATAPGQLAVSPPRRAARGRERDRLLVHLLLSGNEPFTTAETLQLTSGLAAVFYATPGSLTAAMRAGAEWLNRTLLERNLRSSGSGQYTIGTLVVAGLRAGQLLLLISGPAHVFALGSGPARHIYDPQMSGRGLGLGQTLTSYFAQVELSAGDRVLTCGILPPPWESALLASEYARMVFDRELHDRLCREVLEASPEAPGLTLNNALAQERARQLLDSSSEYFGE